MTKYRYYKKPCTSRAIKSFFRNLPNMGDIIRVQGTFTNKRWYRVRFINDKGQQFIFVGFGWFYSGEGSRGLKQCLEALGIHAEWVTSQHLQGDTYSPNSFLINLGVIA